MGETQHFITDIITAPIHQITEETFLYVKGIALLSELYFCPQTLNNMTKCSVFGIPKRGKDTQPHSHALASRNLELSFFCKLAHRI